ncbi:MAG: hypothetical protein ACOH2T_29190 [Pseudomonas sp.]
MAEMTMAFQLHGSGVVEGDMSGLRDMAAEQWPAQLAHLKEMSLCAGKEVVLNLRMFGMEWSPAYHYESDEPVAWHNNATGERIEGAAMPPTIEE